MNDSEDKLRSALSARAERVRVDDPGPKVQHRIVARRRRRRQRLALGGGALAVLLVVAVLVPVLNGNGHSSPTTNAASVAAPPGVLRSKLVRDTRPAVPASVVAQLARANTETALDLYRQLAKTPGNVFLSPYSIETALSMAAAGARGETLDQMLALLHDRLSPAQFHDATNALNLALLAPRPLATGSTGNPLELEVANSVWSQSGFSVERAFLDLLARDYGAALDTVDFEHAAERATTTINAWVDAHTNHMIPNLLSQLDPSTRLVLVNAVHFKGSWAEPFTPAQTAPWPFMAADGTKVDAPFMHRDGSGLSSYAAGAGWQAVDLPYLGGASMTVVMPAAGTLPSFDASLDSPRLTRILGSMHPAYVNLAMPKFTLDDKSELSPMLEALGMKDAFDSAADFSGIDGRRDLAISQVVHDAKIKVDEHGTEAAAATAVGFEALSRMAAPTIDLTLDHPFLYFIRDTKTGTILFMGRVTDPTQTSAQQ